MDIITYAAALRQIKKIAGDSSSCTCNTEEGQADIIEALFAAGFIDPVVDQDENVLVCKTNDDMIVYCWC